jgi:hypothetical protein
MLFVLAVELTVIMFILNREDMTTITLQLQRAAYRGCQFAAQGFGTLGMKLEQNYRVRVAP